MLFTVKEFMLAVPCSSLVGNEWYPNVLNSAEKWGIDTRRRIAGFIAQMSYESGRFTTFTESLNYSAQSLAITWPNHFAVDPKAKTKVPNTRAMTIGRVGNQPADQRRIANAVYGGRFGNRADNDDGWDFRGRGPKQITFKENYAKCGAALGIDLVKAPNLLLQPAYGAEAAAWYWVTHGCNELIDKGDYAGVTRAINGGLNGFEDGNTEGLDDRVELHAHANMVFGVA